VKTLDSTAPVGDYIREALPWAHGHQVKGLTDFIVAILERQTGNQAELARGMGNQEAAVKRLGRLIHNARLDPRPGPSAAGSGHHADSAPRESASGHRLDD
jgi:hypothetical protein